MRLWEQVKRAADDAVAERHELRSHLKALWVRVSGRSSPASTEEPPTVTVDTTGHARVDGENSTLVLLGRSALLLAASAMLAGLTWAAVFFLALYLIIRRLIPGLAAWPAPAV